MNSILKISGLCMAFILSACLQKEKAPEAKAPKTDSVKVEAPLPKAVVESVAVVAAVKAQATKDDAEIKVNTVYALYQSQKSLSPSVKAAAMAKLKEARTAFKSADYPKAVEAATAAEKLLTP